MRDIQARHANKDQKGINPLEAALKYGRGNALRRALTGLSAMIISLTVGSDAEIYINNIH